MNNRAAALILSFLVIAVLTALSAAFFMGSITESNIVQNYFDSTRAFWVAEAGLQKGIYAFKNDNWEGWGEDEIDPSTKILSSSLEESGTYTVRVLGIGADNITIESEGVSSGSEVRRKVKADYKGSSLFNAAAFGKTKVS